MRGFILSLFLIVCAAASFAQTQVAKRTSYGRGYLEYVPADYASSSTLYPCIVFLHGAGERGDGSPADLERVKSHGVPKFIKNGSTMCFTVNGKTECFIVLSPQQETNKLSWIGDVIPFIKFAISNYRIDPNRVYLTGLSMGGGWNVTYDLENDPNYLAAFTPVSTQGDYKGAQITAARKIPVWAFHGDKDTSFSLFEGKVAINGMNSVGANPAPIFTVVADGTHSDNTWDKVYSPTHTYYNPNVYEWFLTQKRVTTGASPVANAGADKIITLPENSAILNGSGTDSDGTVTNYSWKQSAGPTTATTTALNNPSITVSNCVQGKYTFTLTVTDNNNKTSSDTVSIIIGANVNQLPVANAGVDNIITLPKNTVVLTGSGVDSDGQITRYSWKQSSGPTTATTSDVNNPALTLSNLSQGAYTFSLTVTDNANAVAVDDVIVSIKSGTNQPPVVNAGSDKMISLPSTTATLNAIASDPDGSIVSYQWTKTWGPSAKLTNATTSSASIVATTAGTYTFKVIVTDDKGLKTSDIVNVTIKTALPVANAGADQQIFLPVTQASLQGSGTDADGSITNYLWTQTSGPTAVINNSSLATIQVSKLTSAGEYVFLLTVTDNDNQKASDYVKVFVYNSTTSQASAGRVSMASQSEEVLVEETSSIATLLNQNYPNPFSSQTTIPFTLQSSQHVMVKVYDSFGSEVQTLVNDDLQAGEHSVAFSPDIPNQFFIVKLFANGKLFSVKATQFQ